MATPARPGAARPGRRVSRAEALDSPRAFAVHRAEPHRSKFPGMPSRCQQEAQNRHAEDRPNAAIPARDSSHHAAPLPVPGPGGAALRIGLPSDELGFSGQGLRSRAGVVTTLAGIRNFPSSLRVIMASCPPAWNFSRSPTARNGGQRAWPLIMTWWPDKGAVNVGAQYAILRTRHTTCGGGDMHSIVPAGL